MNGVDHHSTYLARAVAALTPEGRKRAEELLDQLAVAGRRREWVVRFAMAREAEVDDGQTVASAGEEPGERLSQEELDILTAGFMSIRDQERARRRCRLGERRAGAACGRARVARGTTAGDLVLPIVPIARPRKTATT